MTEISGTFRRDVQMLPEVFELVGSFFSRAEIDSKFRFPIELAVEEIFTNLVRHNPHGRGEITIRLDVRGGELVVALTDFDTARFDINTDVPDVDVNQPLDRRRPGGLGVHLVKKVMDRVDYSHNGGIGTITLYKHLG
jgi:serine/threonine-protein kinase RsbW